MKFKIYELGRMNMPFTIQIVNEFFDTSLEKVLNNIIKEMDNKLLEIEEKFSPFISTSYVNNHVNIGEQFENILLDREYQSVYIESVLAKKETKNLFDPYYSGSYNPTGLVKGWAIELIFNKYLTPLLDLGVVEACAINGAGDIKVKTKEQSTFEWNIGIENPLATNEIIASYKIKNGCIATSGFSKRGKHTKVKGNNIQTTVLTDNLITSEIYATVLLVGNKDENKVLIDEKKLTAIIINETIEIYEKGKYIYAQKS